MEAVLGLMANCVKCGRVLPAFSFGKRICRWCVQHEAAQRGEASEVQRVETPPWLRRADTSMYVTQAFVGICAAAFIGMAAAGVSLTEPTSRELIQWGANFGPLTLGGQWWRLITMMFLHGGILHIAMNMWCLWSLGRLGESLYGRWTFGAVYLISGVGASVASVFWHPMTVSVGASGAIFGLAGALIASLKFGEFSLPSGAIRGTLSSVVIFVGYSLVFGAMSGFTDNAAHIGGLITGLILGLLIARVAPERDRLVARVAVLGIVLLAVVGCAAGLQHSRGFISHVQRASQFIEQNNVDGAIAELQAAVRQHPQDPLAHSMLAIAYREKRQFDKAEVELKQVLALYPNDETTLYWLGFVYLDQNRTQEARAAFTRMLALNPRNPNAHYGLGKVLRAEGDCQAAIEEFKLAAEGFTAKPAADEDPAYYEIGLCYAKLKKYDDAIAAFQQGQQYNGDDRDTELALADAYKAKGMRKEADDALQRAAKLKSGE